MRNAYQSPKTSPETKFSIEWRKICGTFALWQAGFLSCILLASGTGFAQLSTASLGGVVRDSSGAVVPSAKIVLTNVETSVEHSTTSNATGAYLFTDITPGKYTVRTSVQGFAEQRVPPFTLTVGQSATIDFALSVGSQTTVVTVQGATPQLEASSANLGTVIETKQVNDLPVPGRDFTGLLVLTPGVSPVNNGQGGQGQGSYATPEPINQNSVIPSVNGQGSRSDYFFTDGLSNFGAFHSVYAVPPIIDEIQEFKIVSHADSAEYGSVLGGVVNVTTLSGTNDFHGTAFEYFRNAGMDAIQAFTDPTHPPSFNQNEFGGVAGGPVLLPKLYNGRKTKTFVFGSYQGFRYSLTAAKLIRVPTAAQLAGDESDWPTQIFNPFTTAPDPANPGQFMRQPYKNNQITPDPNMVAWAKFVYPAAGPIVDTAGHDATDSTPTTQTINQWTARIDQKLGQNDSVWFRYSRDTSVVSESGGVPGLINSVVVPNRNYGGSYVHVFSPSLVLQVLFGRTTVGDNAILEFTKSTQALINQIGFSPSFVGNFAASPGRNFLPGLDIAGGGVGGSASFASPGENYALHPDVPNANQYSGVLTKIFGKHTISFGGGFITNKFSAPITTDNINYAAQETGNPENSAQPGDALASFLLNVPDSADRRNVDTETRPGGVMSEFLQDSWRVSSKLTINAGLRYDLTLFPPVGTVKQIGVNGGPETGDIDFTTGTYIVQKLPPLCSVRGFAPCIPGGGPGPGGLPANVVVSPNDKIMNNTLTNVGPHLGFAYKVTDRTVVRGAAGIIYDNWAGVLQLAQNVDGLWPDIGQQEPTGLNPATSTPTVTSQNPLASSGSGSFVPAPTPFTQEGFEYDPHMKTPYSEQWSFGVQQLLSSSTTVTVNYVGSSTHRMDVGGIYGGALTPGTGPIQPRQLFPSITPTFYDRSTGRGNYNALQALLERRFANGFSYSVSYTWSKSIDVGGDGYFGVEGGVPQDAYDPGHFDRSVSGLDLKHILAVNTLYEVPVGKGKRFSTGNGALDYILGNWQINNIFQAHSGSPLTCLDGNDVSNTGSLGFVAYEHCNVVASPAPTPEGKRFNTNAFALPASGTYGDAGRNSIRGPDYWDLDSSVFRNFPVGEGRQFQFRAEAQNLANHVNLGQPDGSITDGQSFGTISGTAYSNTSLNRELEIAVKFIF